MWTIITFALFLGTLIALLIVLNTFTRRIAELEKQRAELQVEEDRVFDFLHGLGEAFSEGVRSADLHRLIVEGAVRILDAHGGALYLVDKTESRLVPAFISKGCPAMVPVPRHILEQAQTTHVALDSYLRLQTIKGNEGVIGSVWKTGTARLCGPADFAPPSDAFGTSPVDTALVGPLVYRRKVLGVLGLANAPLSTPFAADDMNVFQTIAEQSAFALYNEAIYLEASEKKRLDHDLEIAREIQSVLLPSSPPDIPGYEISGVNVPARQVSGDYFDYLHVDDDKTGIAIADVSGKGVPASLIMAMCRSVIRSQATGNTSASGVLSRVNAQLYPDIKEDMFISMAYVIVDRSSNHLTLARAGHDAPLLFRANSRAVESLTPKGMALGIDSGEVFNRVCADFSFEMAVGDCLLLYTDGAAEALNDEGEEFGLDRVSLALKTNAAWGAALVVQRLIEELTAFVGNSPRHDDITLICIRRR